MQSLKKMQLTTLWYVTRMLTLLASSLLVLACSTTSTSVSAPIALADCPRPPEPSVQLMTPPPPSGSFLKELQTWQQNAQQTLNASPTRSADSRTP